MSKDDETLDDEIHPEDWTPEKEKQNDPDKLLQRYMAIAERLVANLESTTSRNPYSEIGRAAGQAQAQIQIRRIRNGHILSYYEAVPAAHSQNLGTIHQPVPVEIYLKDYKDAEKYVGEALKHSDLLAETAEKVRKHQEEYARAPQYVRPMTPGDLRSVAPWPTQLPKAPPATRVAEIEGATRHFEPEPDQEEETKRVDPPPAAPPAPE